MAPFHQQGNIIWLENTDSTNSELRRRIDELDNLSVIAAREQTKGRGQGTHTWYSSPRTNLTFSMLYRYEDLDTSDALLITCLTTLGIRDYLLGKGIVSRIKWFNDIWVEDRKICGILIENILDGSKIKSSIVGIGLNVNESGWPSDLPNPVSMKDLTGKTYDLDTEMEALQKAICRRYDQLGSGTGRKSLQEEFEKYMFRLPAGPR